MLRNVVSSQLVQMHRLDNLLDHGLGVLRTFESCVQPRAFMRFRCPARIAHRTLRALHSCHAQPQVHTPCMCARLPYLPRIKRNPAVSRRRAAAALTPLPPARDHHTPPPSPPPNTTTHTTTTTAHAAHLNSPPKDVDLRGKVAVVTGKEALACLARSSLLHPPDACMYGYKAAYTFTMQACTHAAAVEVVQPSQTPASHGRPASMLHPQPMVAPSCNWVVVHA